uniref:hypothetical protein n=1 Tax=[Ruminococcus] torques TaxID=33039 RepID=UPI00402AD8E2
MKNWEYNNEFTEDAKSLEQQAIENFTETILLAISSKQQASYKQIKDAFGEFDFYEHYRKTYDWLNSEHKEG